ncbi:MAG: hypothetical protein SGJ27_18815 [Candidatus Melainabacteria bacterium]|nr:hypothetical protein [Candidatus Melainabacteria bacterium]
MDMWSFVLMFALLSGIMGWCMTPVINGVLWFCDWRDGATIDWGLETAFAIAVPFAWMFALVEIIILYHH